MFFIPQIAGGLSFVKRDDLSAVDYDYTALTRNDVWQELDLSSIIPVGTKIVWVSVISVTVTQYDTANQDNGGTTNHIGCYGVYNITSGVKHFAYLAALVPDANRKIMYKIKNTGISGSFTIRGWFK